MPRFGRKRAKPSIITLADKARDQGQWERAAGYYREALLRKPQNPPIWVQYGHVLKESGHLAEAEKAYRTALAYDGHSADSNLQLGHVLKAQGKKEDAKAAYLRAFACGLSLDHASHEFAQLGWSEAHFTELSRMLGRDIAEPMILTNVNDASVDHPFMPAAQREPAGRRQIEFPPDRTGPRRTQLASSKIAAEAPSRPLRNHFRIARLRLKRAGPSPITLADRARDAGQWELATEHYRATLDRNPRNSPIWVQYGHVLKESGHLAEAEKAYRRALEYDASTADAHVQLGHVLKLQGRREGAAAAYLHAFSLDPTLVDPLAELRGLGWSEGQVATLKACVALRGFSARETAVPELQDNVLQAQLVAQGQSSVVETLRQEVALLGGVAARADRQANEHMANRALPPGSALAKPVFSVIIPVYNRTWELREALDSVLSQTFPDFEVIIVTDATPVETMEIIYGYIDKDQRVRAFFYADNSGNACRGRNRGIIEARGEFISLLDSDDLYFPNTLEKVYRIFREREVDFVCGRAYYIVDGTRRVGDLVTGSSNEVGPINVDRLMRENPIQTCTVHLRRDLLLEFGGFRLEQKYLEDLELWLRLAYHGCRFYYSDELFSKYRFHQGNLELKYIDQMDHWLEQMRSNYLRPFDNWGIGPAVDREASFCEDGRYQPNGSQVERRVSPDLHGNERHDAARLWSERVDAEWYPRQYPDVARAGADPLDHFIKYGVLEGRKPNAAEAKADGWISVTYVEISCLKPPMLREEVALFVTHSPDGLLKRHVRHYLDCLTRQGVAVILIVAADEPFTAGDADLMSGVDGIFVRQNNGYDFAAWAHILRLHPELRNADILYLLNDSVFGPTNDAAFNDLLGRIRNSNADFIGLTESFEGGWHLQSYFLALKSRALSSVEFRDFIEGIVCYRDKEQVICAYELRFALIMKIAGFHCEAMFQKTDVRNPTIFHWRRLLDAGFPFLKVTTVRDAPPGVDIAGWRQVLAAQGYDISLTDQLDEVSAARGMLRETGRSVGAARTGGAYKRTAGLDILIFSHDLTESGAPRAAFDVARILRDAGHFVAVASPNEGPYRERLNKIGVDVIVDQFLFNQGRDVLVLARNFDKVICNTIVCWPVVAQLRNMFDVYWYVHESGFIHQLVKDVPELAGVMRSDVTFLVPSTLPADALAVYGLKTRIIGLGVDDLSDWNSQYSGSNGKVVIGVFGSYELRKGQDLAVKGMLSLPQELRARAELRLFGRSLNPGFRDDLEQIAGGDPSILFLGEVDHDECLRQMAASDIILVPSRDDPLPFVTLDALSLGKTLVCSNTTGTSAYLDEGRSGLILRENTPEEIGRTLARVISDPELRKMLGRGAHQTYEQNFTVPVFTAKLLSALDIGGIPANTVVDSSSIVEA
jgi:tetratricopeptide (TPR) repeat protein/glycosyltransferase involved in cell wall biosynthesis